MECCSCSTGPPSPSSLLPSLFPSLLLACPPLISQVFGLTKALHDFREAGRDIHVPGAASETCSVPPVSPAEPREAPSGTREARMGVSRASQAPGPPPNTQITLAEDSPALRKISAATSGAPHSGAIFRLLVLICKDINVPTISKYAPESANCIFPAALNYVLLRGRLVLVDPVLHKHHCGDVSTFRVSVPDPALVHLPSSARSYFPVPFSPFISLRQNLLTKKRQKYSTVLSTSNKDKSTSGPSTCNFLFFTQKKK